MIYPLLQNPNVFVWDFWYYYDAKESIFHLLYLNADPSLVPSNQHHFYSRVGYAITRDFTQINWVNDNVFHAQEDDWDNTSIWSGDIVRISNGFLLYYTSRNKHLDDGFTQSIGAAFSRNLLEWKRVSRFRLVADTRYYEPRSLKDDTTIHAWRDPFLFRYSGNIYMLVSAKDRRYQPGRKGGVGLMQSVNDSLTNWKALPPIFSPGWYSECEVPQLYKNGEKFWLVYSSWARYDSAPSTENLGGLHAVDYGGSNPIEDGFSGIPKVLLPEKSGLYACRIIPELQGDIVGHDIRKGGLKRIPANTNLMSVNRDFSDLRIEMKFK